MSKSSGSSHKQILRSSAIIGSSSVINILIGLVRLKVAALILGPLGVGLIGILQNLMTTASTVAAMGFGNVGTRQIAMANGQENQFEIDAARRALFWGTLLLALAGGVIFWSLRTLIADIVLADPALAPEVGWLSIGVALTVAVGSQRALLNGMRRIGDIARITVLSSVFSTAIGVATLVLLGREGLLIFVIAAPLASFFISQIYVTRLPAVQGPATPFKELVGQWHTLARLGFAFMIASLITVVGQLIVRSIVQTRLGPESLGYFQAAWAISMTYIGFVLGAMGTDYYPRLTAAIHDHKQTNQLVNEQSEVAILLAGPVFLSMLALAPWIIQLLYSSEFSMAVSVLRWQILGDIFKIMSWPLGFVLLAAGDSRAVLLTETGAISVFIFVTWIAMPTMQIEATGVGFLAMYLFHLPAVLLLAIRRTRFRWSKRVINDFLLLLGMAITTATVAHWSDSLSVFLGLFFAAGFGLMSLCRLIYMAELSGRLGKVVLVFRRIFKKAFPDHDW